MKDHSFQIDKACGLFCLIPQHYTIFASFLQGKNGFASDFAGIFTKKKQTVHLKKGRSVKMFMRR
jgi:hypothetical protein